MELELLKTDGKPQTEAGSYFVANYPPFSTWTRDGVADAHAALNDSIRVATSAAKRDSGVTVADRGGATTPLGLYLHIPFCRKRCKFCYFRVYTDKNASEVDLYMDALAREISIYKNMPRLADRQFEFVYFGGGTPSFLSNDQLLRLIERINRHWRWDAAREVTFECEPGTLKKSKLEAIKSIGVTRLSLGIEHWDDAILEMNGRAHRSKEIGAAYEWAREVGFAQINVDLIAGMVGETDEKWQLAVEKTLALRPDSVTIYQMELPFNTVFTKEMRDAGGGSPVADWPTKRAWVAYAFEQFERGGYEVSSGYTLIRRSEPRQAAPEQTTLASDQSQRSSAPTASVEFVYRNALWHGGDMVGTGVASFSHVGGVHYQNEDKWESYLSAIDAGTLPIARALRPTARQLLIRELILQLKTGRLDLSYFRRKFGLEPRSEFADGFDSLVSEGAASITGDRVELTRSALLRVDSLLTRFFEAEHRGVRYT